MTDTIVSAEIVRVPRKLHQKYFGLAEQKRVVYEATIEAGIPFEDVFAPEFWSHIATRLRPGDRIEVVDEKLTYWAELIVLSAERLNANVAVLRKIDLTKPEASATDAGFSVGYEGRIRKWAVTRTSDKQIVRDGFGNRDEATAWLSANARTLAA